MSDGFVTLAPDSFGKKVDASELTVGANTVERQRIVISDPTVAAGIALVGTTPPGVADAGLTVRNIPSGTQSIASTASANNWGQALAVTNAATATLVSIPSASAGYRIKGFICHGTGDGYFAVQIAAATVFSGRTRSTLPMLVITLPNGIAVSTGAAVALKVTNESGSTADYEGTLLGD